MPQTVPNKPMKGAVEPTEARMTNPDCSRDVLWSMVAQTAGDPVADVQGVMQMGACVLMVAGGHLSLLDQLAKWVVMAWAKPHQAFVQIRTVPKAFSLIGQFLVTGDVQGLDQNDHPRCQ